MEKNLTLVYQSNCKINLGLQILNKRNDNFHNLESIFVEIHLFDDIIFKKSNIFQFTSDNESITQLKNNTISQAYNHLRLLSNNHQEYSIHLSKNIPIGSGLGGGSSNAATVLKVLNNLWGLQLSNDKLMQIGASIGSDVPFFINGGVQYIEGVGNILTPLNDIKISKYIILLVYPNIHIDTQWAYQSLKKGLEVEKSYNKFLDFNNQVNWKLLKNDFENVVFSTYPEISEIKKQLISKKVLYAGLSGSGSTVYGVFANNEDAINASKLFPSYRTYITSPIV